MARRKAPRHARHRGDRGHLSRARLHDRDRPGSRDGAVQLRLAQLPAEPSAEMDVQCGVCGGVGCGVCKQTGWVEILGSGMVHPAVLEATGVDSERYTGWAFGMGPARIALSRYGIPDIRLLYDSDVRFLEQVAGQVIE